MNGVTKWEATEIIREKNARIAALIAAGDKLAKFAGHDDGYQVSCDLLEKPCNCGYGEAWKAWKGLTK